ncbi:hypothetical protein U1Q18_046656 [Sarracenia purpurea var. burkii]
MCLSQHASAMCARKWASPLLLSDHVLLLGAIKCYCWLPYGGGYCKVMLRVAAKCYCWLPRGGGHCKVMLWVAAMVAISVGQCEPTDGSMLALLGCCMFSSSSNHQGSLNDALNVVAILLPIDAVGCLGSAYFLRACCCWMPWACCYYEAKVWIWIGGTHNGLHINLYHQRSFDLFSNAAA